MLAPSALAGMDTARRELVVAPRARMGPVTAIAKAASDHGQPLLN